MIRIDALPHMKTLSERMIVANGEGYTENFKVTAHGLSSEDERLHYLSEEVMIIKYYRFEGSTNPDDSAILYLLKAKDGTRGILMDAYGVYASTAISEFIKPVDILRMKHEVPTQY